MTKAYESHHGEFEGNFYEIILGLNWTPIDNLRVRPEVRWDWFNGQIGSHGSLFDAGGMNDPLMVTIDAILLF